MAKTAANVQFKTPREVAPFNFDFAEDLTSGESISVAVIKGTSDLSITAPSISGDVVQIKISQGTHGLLYLLRCEIDTDSNNHYEGGGKLVVETCS
jgi:hypothetical protein